MVKSVATVVVIIMIMVAALVMIDSVPSWLWIIFTLLAAIGQVFRNAMQRSLTAQLGTAGATHVRFLYGLPFGLLFLFIVWKVSGQPLPQPQAGFWAWIFIGAMTQIVATGLMLAAMKSKSFVQTTAYIKTEPVQVAIFAAIFLGDRLAPWMWISVIVATAGVVMMSWQKAPEAGADGNVAPALSLTPVLLGLSAAALFALASVGFRGAVLHLGESHFVLRASMTLAIGLTIQTLVLSAYLLLRERDVLVKLARLWRPSMIGGFLGAASSQMWYIAFALATVAQVRTLALVEIFIALMVSKKLFAQGTTRRELMGMLLIALGVAGVTMLGSP